jgi:hypothetical protein
MNIMMLFKPEKLDLKPVNLIIIPYSPSGSINFNKPVKSFNILKAKLLIYEDYSILTGFLGYPHLLTILEFLPVLDCEVFFLGTAGCLNSHCNSPEIYTIDKIHPSGIFKFFSNGDIFNLKPLVTDSAKIKLKNGTATSIDILQRETKNWLSIQKSSNMDCVEMEIYPLRVYLKREFSVLLVTSDNVKENGILRYQNNLIRKKFQEAFELIKGCLLDEKKNFT